MGRICIRTPPGYIAWHDLHLIHESDQQLDCNLRMAPKLTKSALHPGNNKQYVNLALAIFDEKLLPLPSNTNRAKCFS